MKSEGEADPCYIHPLFTSSSHITYGSTVYTLCLNEINCDNGAWKQIDFGQPHLESLADKDGASTEITLINFQDIYCGVMKVCHKQKVFLLSLSLLTRCQLCVYVCVCVCYSMRVCGQAVQHAPLCVTTPDSLRCQPQEVLTNTYKWTDKQPHTIIHTHITLSVCVWMCTSVWVEDDIPDWHEDLTNLTAFEFLVARVVSFGFTCLLCHCESVHFILLSWSARFVVSVEKSVSTHPTSTCKVKNVFSSHWITCWSDQIHIIH